MKTSTGKPHTDSKEIHKLWTAHLREAGLRHRGINQCRHTFASRLLTTGKYPEKWIANYLGHTTTAMLHKHYGKFIEADTPDLETRASEDLRLTVPSAKTNNMQRNTNKEENDFNPVVTQKTAATEKIFRNELVKWRRERDSNPRSSFPDIPLAGARLQPLGHLSRLLTYTDLILCS